MAGRNGSSRTLEIAQRDGWICNGCGEVCVPYEINLPREARIATVDHRDPNGGNSQENLWLMCATCNSSKGNRSIEEWEKTLDFDGSFLRRGFTQIPNGVLSDTSVSIGARMTLITLMQFAWNRDAFPGQGTLSKMLGVTDRTVRDYLTELKDAGYIKVYRRGRGQTNVYRIVQNKIVAAKPPEESSDDPDSDRNSASALDRNSASDKEYEVEEDTDKIIAAAPRERPRNAVWDTLGEIFGEPTTRSAQKVRGKVCSSLTAARASPDEITARAKRWPLHFDGATLTDLALEKHWDTLGRQPLRRQA